MPSETHPEPRDRRDLGPVIEPGHTFASVTEKISSVALTQKTPRGWFIGFALSFALTMVLLVAFWGVSLDAGFVILFGFQGLLTLASGCLVFRRFMQQPLELGN
jgi:hypothetical protein